MDSNEMKIWKEMFGNAGWCLMKRVKYKKRQSSFGMLNCVFRKTIWLYYRRERSERVNFHPSVCMRTHSLHKFDISCSLSIVWLCRRCVKARAFVRHIFTDFIFVFERNSLVSLRFPRKWASCVPFHAISMAHASLPYHILAFLYENFPQIWFPSNARWCVHKFPSPCAPL